MPLNEIEIHPFLNIGEIIPAKRMIVGTFPIYSLTNPRSERKNQLQAQRNDISFFYGSRSNYFWNWYSQYVDNQVNIQQPGSICTSLEKNHIAISDVIYQCSRKDESFNDADLLDKQWNPDLASIIEKLINKVICTSKSSAGAMGWLVKNILIPSGFSVDEEQSNILHEEILMSIPQSNTAIKPIALVLTKDTKKLSAVSLPSPGSPMRKLANFGHVPGVYSTSVFLELYLNRVFSWFMEG